MQTIKRFVPHWRECRIHESSPMQRGASFVLARDCAGYIGTHFFPEIPRGGEKHGFRCEDLENQTFSDETFDLVVSQDVMEHLFRPDRAYSEIWRTLKPGGHYIHTFPIYKHMIATEQQAKLAPDGSIHHLVETPEYHGNPIDGSGSLVTFNYGYDVGNDIARWAPFDVEIIRFNQRSQGIVAEFNEVIVCRKTS